MDIRDQLKRDYEAWKTLGHDNPWYAFLLKHGVDYVGRPFTGKQMTRHECFKNAFEYASQHDMLYAEGVVLRPPVPVLIHHAWVVDDKGNAVDPTLDRPEECSYIGVELDEEVVVGELLKNEYYCLFAPNEMYNIEFMKQIDEARTA